MSARLPKQTLCPNSSQAEDELANFNREKDCLYILPLSMIPLETASLKRARLIKDARLNNVVELFHDAETGSGRLNPNRLSQVFDWPEDRVHPDLATINALSEIHSFDVFSLRIELRRLDIKVNDEAAPIDWTQVIFKGLTLKGIYGREMFETWYKMTTMLQSGLDITPVLTHAFAIDAFQQGFDVMRSGRAGKVILDWD